MKTSLTAEFLLLAAIWGSSFLFMHLGAVEFGPWANAGLRVGVATAVLLPILVWRGQWHEFRRHAAPILASGLLNAGIPFALYSYALLSIPTGLTAILNATTPLFGALVAWLWLKERPGAWRTLGLALGFAGVLLLSWDKAQFHAGGSGWAVLACLGATLCYGIAASYTKKRLTGVPALPLATGNLLGAAVALAPATVWFWPERMPSALAWASIITVGVLCTALAYIVFFRLIEQAGPSKTLTVTFLIPVFALGYGWGLLGEQVSLFMALGGVVILAGVALATGLVAPKRTQP
ncbi:MAG TPA: DMT family transporter [Macromonas sp.]|nr:DMT family transporter [Macromonas sp.]